MSSYVDNLPEKMNFSEEEEKILKYWNTINAFQTSLKLSEGKPEYTFYDGPPFATGLPHYGHILAGTIKDTVTRFAHQTGHYVSRRFGWDCHGLPVEFEIDQKLKINGRQMVLDMGVENYNNECRAIVQRYTTEWRETVTRLGRWIDFDNDYKTMDPSFMESVWWVFQTMFKKGLVYRGYKVMPYSTYCGTPLSNFEAGQNYKDVNDPAIVVSFPLVDKPDEALLAWTTTPWTLPSNLALCVNDTFDYVKIKDKTRSNKIFYILEKRLVQLFPEVGKADCTDERRAELYEVLERLKGSSLVGLKYTPLFNYFAASNPQAFRVISDGYVTEEGGTGIVHQAPAFGEDDYRVCIKHGIVSKAGEDLPCPVDANGRFTSSVPDFQGKNVKEADSDICLMLKAQGRMIMKETYMHSYPFCWRSDTPLIYKAVPSWFVAVEKVKPQLLANNAKTYWVPSFVQEKRFHNWLSEAKDWAISRNRFWGTPIPLWVSDDFEELVSVGSVDELEKLSGVRVTDLHKENIDHITIPSQKGKGVLKRVDEVFDCWFESGSMPYAQLHYPFENQDRFEGGFPADFIAEGLDQTRGWFYTLTVIATCLFDKPAFKNLVVNGLVLASDGKKMSKRLKNYPPPEKVVNACGADALRLYLINSPVVRADVLKFQEDGVGEVVRNVLIPWYNTFRFFAQAVSRWDTSHPDQKFVPNIELARSSTNDVDIWIMAATLGLVEYVHQEMKAYRLYTVVPRLVEFIDDLSKWYLRLNRFRIKGELGEEESYLGLNVLYEVLCTMSQIMAPFTPFFTEFLYQNLRKLHPVYGTEGPVDSFGRSDSVHYLMLPLPDESRLNRRAEERFKTLQQSINLVRIARERRRIRNNLPLKSVTVVAANENDIEALEYLKTYFMSEINAWDVQMTTDWEKMCLLKMQPNWKDLGKRLGKQMKSVAKAVNELTKEQISNFMHTGEIELCGFKLTQDDIVVKREFNGDTKRYEAAVSEDGSLMIAIDTTQDEELFTELRSRSVVSAVQKLRKGAGLQPSDSVEIFYDITSCKTQNESMQAIENCFVAGAETVLKRLRTFPFPASEMPKNAPVISQDTIEDADIVKGKFTLYLTAPVVSVDESAIEALVSKTNPEAAAATVTASTAMYLQTMVYEDVVSKDCLAVEVDGVAITLVNGTHFFPSVTDKLRSAGHRFFTQSK